MLRPGFGILAVATLALAGAALSLGPPASQQALASVALAPITQPRVAPPTEISGVSDFEFESLSADYFLDADSAGHATTRVVETIVARFPDFDQNRGIIRAIPLYDGDYPLDVTMLSVADGTGEPVYFERNDYDGFAEFALGTDEFVQGRVTYVLQYTMRNTIRHFADSGGDEFYWDVNGNGWAQSFDTVSATVRFSEELAKALTGRAACYLGYYGGTGECELQPTDDGYSVSVGPVAGYNTLTVAIGLREGVVVQPDLPVNSWVVTLAPKLLLGLAGLLTALGLALRVVLWRDARGRGTIIAQFEPDISRGMLLDANIVGRPSAGLAALFVDLAVRGVIRVIDTRPNAPVGLNPLRFALELVSAEGVSRQEHKVLVILFGPSLDPGARVIPGTLSARQGAALYVLPTAAATLATTEGYRAQPAARWPKVLVASVFLVATSFVPLWFWAASFDVLGGQVLLPAFGTFALLVALPILLVKPQRLTSRGAVAKEYLLGIREYLTVAEKDRMRVLQSPEGALRVDANDRGAVVGLNERLLGYAVLWGVEDQWAEHLKAEYGDQTPSWLSGGAFDSSVLRSFSVTSTSAVRPIPTTSSSSGGGSWSSSGGSSFSSGSGGGGFSGGGGGGGGGGGR